MSLQVNFTAHGHDLRAAYEAILRPADPKTSDNWAMFGYDKGTNDLKVLGQGNGGLEELEDEFADGKIQYAFVRIIDPNTQLNKFILIGWCGDGVPESKKGLFNSHLADVSLFLKGYHLQINARCEADVTPAQILKRVNEGSGSKYSIHNETHKAERITPLQSAYKKTEIPDIAALQRNPTKPEPAPKYGLGASKPFGSTSPSTPPTSKPESRSWNSPAASPSSAASPPSSSTERSWKASEGSSYSAPSASFNKVAPPSSLLNYGASTPNEPSMNKAQQIRMEREAREKEERERIKREIEASENRERQAQGQSSAQKQAEERRLQEQLEREREQEAEQQRSQDRAREERAAREREEREAAEAEEAARSAREAFKAREEAQAREQASKADEEKRQQEQLQRQREREEKEANERRLKQQCEEEEAQEREYQRQQHEEEERRRQQQQQDEEEEEQRRVQQEEEERRLHEEHAVSAAAAAHVEPAQAEALGAQGSVSAVVLYSYEKAEENEMSLIEGEVIVNVTELDVGWWSGESTDGSRSGLFPANYVEVIEQAEEHPAAAAIAEEHHVQEVATTNGHVAVDEAPTGQPSAVALYDYNAGEPNEISFLEGDVITSIEFVTDDWWSGTTTQGTNGLFPCKDDAFTSFGAGFILSLST
ncbi:hypothetical protein EC968_001043 [Mortierella alpina]|nr:hypothetical protein EC968_001043 [Mortierella alpina]